MAGQLFWHGTAAADLQAAVERFEPWLPRFDPADAVARANLFGPDSFHRGFMAAVEQAMATQRSQSSAALAACRAR